MIKIDLIKTESIKILELSITLSDTIKIDLIENDGTKMDTTKVHEHITIQDDMI
jgi:hypothetical protein